MLGSSRAQSAFSSPRFSNRLPNPATRSQRRDGPYAVSDRCARRQRPSHCCRTVRIAPRVVWARAPSDVTSHSLLARSTRSSHLAVISRRFGHTLWCPDDSHLVRVCVGGSPERSCDTLRLFRHLHLVWTFLASSSRRAARCTREATPPLMFVASDDLEWRGFDFFKTSKAPHACGGHDSQHCDGTPVLLSIARRRHGTWCMADVSAGWHALPVQRFAFPFAFSWSPVRAARPADAPCALARPALQQLAPHDYSDALPR